MSSPFVGREAELEVLRDAAARALEGQAVTMLVSGEAGVGKTRVATELAVSLTSDGWWCPVSHGVFLEGGEIPFGGAAELVGWLARAAGEAEVRRLIGRSSADLAALVPSLAPDAPRVLDRGAVTTAVRMLLERVEPPMCWVLDDLQWMDGATRDLVAYLAKVGAASPLLLLGTVRTDPAVPSRLPGGLLELGRAGRVVTVAPLDREHVAAQARGLAERPLDDEEVARICAVSDGLPFFVEELVRYDGRISGSLAAVLHASLGQLSPHARTVLAAAAVGEGFLTPTSLRAVTGLGASFDAAMSEVRICGVLRADPQAGVLRFRHALLREAVDAELLAEERTRLHRSWAQHIELVLRHEPARITLLIERARHRYEAGGAAAFHAALAAARAADAADDDHVRAHWWTRTLDLWPNPAGAVTQLARDRALASCISALWAVGDLGLVVARLDAELSAESDWMRGLWLRLGRQLSLRAQQESFDLVIPPSDAEETMVRVLTAPRDFRSTEVMVWLADDWSDDLPDTAIALLEEARRRLSTRPSRDVVDLLFGLLSMLTIGRGETVRGIELLQELVSWMSEHDPGGVLDARCSLSSGLGNAGRYAEAVRLGEENLRAIRDPELRPHLWVAQHIIVGLCSLHTGDWDRTERCLESALQGAIGGDIASARDFAATLLWARRGDFGRARRHLERIPDVAAEDVMGAKRPAETVWRAYAAVELAAVEDDPRQVRAAFRRFAEISRPGDPVEDLQETCRLALRAGVGRGCDDEESRSLLAEASALMFLGGGGGTLPVMRAEIEAHLARAADQDTVADWQALAQRWTVLERPYDVAYANVFAAECALRQGDREQARQMLSETHATAVRLGAVPLRRRCEATARRGRVEGIRQPAAPARLTAREMEVLAHLALGRTNGEIAATLFISPKTVSVHVSNILAKLGAANRTEAAALARNEGLVPSP